MENFFYDDKFYTDLGDLIEDVSETDDLSDLPEDWQTEVTQGNQERVFTLNPHDIYNCFAEDRDGEYMEYHDEIISLLKKHIPFDVINESMPTMFYENCRDKHIITKKDLLDFIAPESSTNPPKP